jgi:hypothetical protein
MNGQGFDQKSATQQKYFKGPLDVVILSPKRFLAGKSRYVNGGVNGLGKSLNY